MDEINAKAHQRRASGWIPGSAKRLRRKARAKNWNRKSWLRWRERNAEEGRQCR